MEVKLLSHTPDALNLLLRTKNTRLKFNKPIEEWTEEEKEEHLDYMLNTIKSSWEFVEYVFEITGVTRAFTHQLVRTRTAAFAQQSQRTVDVSDQEVIRPESLDIDEAEEWDNAVGHVLKSYSELIKDGVQIQDARGLLPTNMTTSIMMKVSLRSLHETGKTRLCTRTQGEYQDVFRLMRERVIEVHPWAEKFIDVHCALTGTCAFPNYGKAECPFYLPEMDRTETAKKVKEKFWSERYTANPIAKRGKAV